MTKWYALTDTGAIEYLGEFESVWAAEESSPRNTVWIASEDGAREWLRQLVEMLA